MENIKMKLFSRCCSVNCLKIFDGSRKEPILPTFYNRQKTRKNIVQNIGVFVNVLQNQTKLTRIHNGL